jgi:hypothetical protein
MRDFGDIRQVSSDHCIVDYIITCTYDLQSERLFIIAGSHWYVNDSYLVTLTIQH